MTRLALASSVLALLSVAAGGVLWWLTGAWHYGDLSTRGLLHAALFALAAVICHAVAAVLRRRGS